jgi:uncharacterized glyoxalase superfamily protein PhnB
MHFSQIPIFRIFDEAKARQFYCDYLGMTVDFEHRFEPGMPLYMQVKRDDLVFHLSEHHGDGTPGSRMYIMTDSLDDLHAELRGKDYPYLRPGIEDQPWGHRNMSIQDPFGNTLIFADAQAQA